MANHIIEVRHFTKKYGDFAAVDDISFHVEAGAVFAFLGPNGAGKSTTINTLCTIQEKTGGELYVDGHDVTAEKDAVRGKIGIVFQDSTLDAKLTVEQNLRFHCLFYHVPKNEHKDRIGFVLDLVDLKDSAKAPVESLSGGMKRRVEIARGLLHFPKVLFLDEPTAGLDPQTRANVWDYIRRMQRQKSTTIFLTTHYLDEAEICSSLAIIDYGKIAAFDTLENLKARHAKTCLKIRTDKAGEISQYLKGRSIPHTAERGVVNAYVGDTDAALEVLCGFRGDIFDFELNKGSLNDVFLAVTGREIRDS